MKGFLPWLGGKHYLANRIASLIEQVPHKLYCEGFMGGAHVFFHLEPAPVEVLNDINRDLVTLFRVLQWHLEEFLRFFKWALVSREEFNRLDKTDPDTLTDVQRAARFYYLQKCSYAAKLHHRSFRAKRQGPPQLNLLRIEEELSAVHLRLARVQIENVPWQRAIDLYDGPDSLTFLDPPYHGVEGYYGKGLFKRDEYAEMAARMASGKGTFLLTLNDKPEVRTIFKGLPITTIENRYPTGNKYEHHVDRVREVLISNRTFPKSWLAETRRSKTVPD